MCSSVGGTHAVNLALWNGVLRWKWAIPTNEDQPAEGRAEANAIDGYLDGSMCVLSFLCSLLLHWFIVECSAAHLWPSLMTIQTIPATVPFEELRDMPTRRGAFRMFASTQPAYSRARNYVDFMSLILHLKDKSLVRTPHPSPFFSKLIVTTHIHKMGRATWFCDGVYFRIYLFALQDRIPGREWILTGLVFGGRDDKHGAPLDEKPTISRALSIREPLDITSGERPARDHPEAPRSGAGVLLRPFVFRSAVPGFEFSDIYPPEAMINTVNPQDLIDDIQINTNPSLLNLTNTILGLSQPGRSQPQRSQPQTRLMLKHSTTGQWYKLVPMRGIDPKWPMTTRICRYPDEFHHVLVWRGNVYNILSWTRSEGLYAIADLLGMRNGIPFFGRYTGWVRYSADGLRVMGELELEDAVVAEVPGAAGGTRALEFAVRDGLSESMGS